MVEIIIEDAALDSVASKVIVVTGCASGIGLATTKLLLFKGAHLVAGDIHPPKEDMSKEHFLFQTTDVTNWDQLKALFKTALDQHGRVDHVFANAGVTPRTSFVSDDVDEHGEPMRSDYRVFAVNFLAVADTVKLAVHYLKKNPAGGSIVLTASASGELWTSFS
jgi:NAD(P)-dependent dehydrogenase (short-subunit alcohol dehydrogenase family)